MALNKLRKNIERIVQPHSPRRAILRSYILIFAGIIIILAIIINVIVFDKAGIRKNLQGQATITEENTN